MSTEQNKQTEPQPAHPPRVVSARATHVAVDPGTEGALAWRDENGAIHVADLPILVRTLKTKTKSGKPRERKHVDTRALDALLRSVVDPARPPAGAIEALNVYNASKGARGGHSNSTSPHSAAAQGANYGRAGACLNIRCATVTVVQPQVWRRHHRLRGSSQKERKAQAVKLACQRHPELEPLLRRKSKRHKSGFKVWDGRADALLILDWLVSR